MCNGSNRRESSGTFKRAATVSAVVAALALASSAHAAGISAFTAAGTNRPGDVQGPFAFSEDFNVGAKSVIVSGLGFFDDGADGLTEAHNVALYDRSNTTTPLATLTVPAGTGATLTGVGTYSNGTGRQGGFRVVNLATPITLPANFQGSVLSYLLSDTPAKTDNYGDGGQGFNDGSSLNSGTLLISFIGTFFNSTNATSGYFHSNSASPLAGGTFVYDVPEPASLGLLAVAATALLARRMPSQRK